MTARFFSMDGVDGAGKSTQLSLLNQWLREQGYNVTLCRDPGSTEVGDAMRDVLLDRLDCQIDTITEMFLYMTARAQLVAEVIQPALAAGRTVLSDRYLLANVVYQGHAGGVDLATLKSIGQVATRGVKPSRTIVLDMPVERSLARIQREQDRMESRGTAFMQKVRDGFLAEAKDDASITVVNADQSVDDLHRDIVKIVSNELD